MHKTILVTGGQRSGKSEFAERLALSLSESPIYVATSRIWDGEYQKRIEIHQKRRSQAWMTIEEDKYISQIEYQSSVILVDCLTLLATNFFYDDKENAETLIIQELSQLLEKDRTFIFVTNEIGLGGTSSYPEQRKFTDILGKVNQFIGAKASEAYFVISGIPLKIKG